MNTFWSLLVRHIWQAGLKCCHRLDLENVIRKHVKNLHTTVPHRQTDGHKDRQTGRQKDKRTNEQTDRQDRQANGLMDTWTDKIYN